MILSKNSDVKGIVVKAIEGKPMYGGDLHRQASDQRR